MLLISKRMAESMLAYVEKNGQLANWMKRRLSEVYNPYF